MPNKVTADTRRAIQMLTDNLAPELGDWIRRGAKRNPLGAAKVLVDLLEFTMPKLQRVEHTTDDGPALFVGRVVWEVDRGPPAQRNEKAPA